MFFKSFFKILPQITAYAHCDIPCKIYDPYYAQVAAHSVIRMTQMLLEADKKELGELKYISHVERLTRVKEEHAEIVKHEIRIIWGDYFKPELIAKFPKVHDLVFEIMHLASHTKQDIDLEGSKKLLAKVQEFAEIFFKSKDVTPLRVKSLYPTEGEMVIYKA